MKTWSQVLVVGMIAAFVLSGATSFAQAVEEGAEVKKEAEVTKDAEVKKEEPSWSVGAGFGFSGYSWGYASTGLSGLSGNYSQSGLLVSQPYASAPLGTIFVERRLNRSFALLLKLEGSYSNVDSSNANNGSNTNNKVGELGVAAGVRWILNPGGFVEVSFYSVLGGSWVFGKNKSKTDPEVSYDTHGYDIGLGVGFAVEKKLLDNLYLRFETFVGRFGYQYDEQDVPLSIWDQTTNESVVQKIHDHYKSIYAFLAFSPVIELRMAF